MIRAMGDGATDRRCVNFEVQKVTMNANVNDSECIWHLQGMGRYFGFIVNIWHSAERRRCRFGGTNVNWGQCRNAIINIGLAQRIKSLCLLKWNCSTSGSGEGEAEMLLPRQSHGGTWGGTEVKSPT